MSQSLEGYQPSSQQKRLWRRCSPTSVPLAQAMVDLGGRVPPQRLREALAALVERHEILRTELRPSAGLKFPVQVIHPASDVALRWEELEPVEAGAVEARAETWWSARWREAVEGGGEARPVDAALLPVVDRADRLLLSLPALRADRRSLAILTVELGRIFDDGVQAAGDEPLQYADFAAWQSELEGGEAGTARNHWRRFETDEVTDALPPAPPVAGRASLRDDVAAAIPAAARSLGVSPLALVAAAWAVLLQRLGMTEEPGGGRPAAPLGALLSGRPLDGLDAMPGPYACALPLSVPFAAVDAFGEVATAFAAALRQAEDWQEHARLERFPSFGSVIEERVGREEESGGPFRLTAAETELEPAPLSLLCTRHGERYGVEIRRRSGAEAAEATEGPGAERLVRRLAVLLSAALRTPETAVADLPLIADDERRILEEWSSTVADLGPDLPFHRLVDRWTERTPEAPAVVAAGESLTYRQLDVRAARLAADLRRHGVVVGDRVALCSERRVDLVAGILAILRSGAAYVPVDPSQPRERSREMLQDAAPRVLLAPRELAESVGFRGPQVELSPKAAGNGEAAPENGGDPEEELSTRHLAYVIFTSGSTGRPKGVAVEHRALVNYVRAIARRLKVDAGWSYATVSTFAADLGHTALFTALATGGCVHLVDEGRAADPDAFSRYAHRHGIDVLKIVPSHLGALLTAAEPAAVLPRCRLVLGGEAPARSLLERLAELAPELAVLNHYGPTEATVGATAGPLSPPLPSEPVPLGRPLANVEIHLLDSRRRPVPLGVLGEIHVGGAGLARGYLGRAAETARRFLPWANGDNPGSRLYATGDLGRLDAEGRLAFLGRADHQVKVRGYRIELGEIESALQEHPMVREAVVLARESAAGQRQLVAYVVFRDAGAQPADLRLHLAERVPDYMIPGHLVELESLPLTANGKVDRAALPEPSEIGPEIEYVAPRTRDEEALAAIWADLLGRERVGVEDNFFDLGGDSILAIRVVARANQQGLRVDPQEIFEHQTVAALAAVTRKGAVVEAEQGPVNGPCPLLPVQRWFFELPLRHRHHWNQAVLLAPVEPLQPVALRQAARAVVEHHDALRARFRRGADGWSQELASPEEVATPFVHLDLAALPAAHWRDALKAAVAALQRGFHLGRGPLFRVAHFTGGDEQRLFLAAHHLVVDAVSWHLLVEDLRGAYQKLRDGEEPRLPAKTTSVRRWAEKLVEYAEDPDLRKQLDFWHRQRGGGELAADNPDGPDVVGAESWVTVSLDAEETADLRAGLRPVLRSEINDVVLAAFVAAFVGTTGSDALCLMLEGHGREHIVEDVDLSRTVGWFTSRFPVLLPGEDDLEATLRGVKQRLRELPSRGLGYGVLRYLGPPSGLDEAPRPQVSFNYFGQIGGGRGGGDSQESTLLTVAPEPRGHDRHPEDVRTHPLSVTGSVTDERMVFSLGYSSLRFRRETVEALAEGFHDRLRELVERVRRGDEIAASATDFPLADLDDAGMAALSNVLDEVDSQP